AYIVVITNTNFVGAGALAGYRNSNGNGLSAPDPDNGGTSALDSDDNGDEIGLYGAASFVVASKPISVTDQSEPTGELGGNGANDPTRDADSNLTVDFGFYRLQLGNLVWEDLNNDGDFDAGESTLNGVTVTLYAADGSTVVSTTTTNASGNYTFTGLLSGTYIVAITPPAGYKSSTGASNLYEPGATTFTGATDSTDHGTNAGAEIRSTAIVLRPGDAATNGNGNAITQNTGNTANPTADFGIWRPASLGDYVWQDADRDGVQDAGETGVNGVTVTLLNNAGQIISTTTTGPNGATNGYYTFTNLISGTYVVSFTNPAPQPGGGGGYRVTKTDTGGEPTDSDGVNNGVASVTGPYVLNAGESIPTVDQGYWRPASLGNYVWYDDNVNGINDEPANKGVNGVTVRLYADDGVTLISTTVTANDLAGNPGYYTFTDLISGSYQVAFDLTTLPVGYQVTQEGPTAGKDFIDSDPISTTGRTETITLVAGEADPTWDMGIWKPSGLGDLVWEDYNHDGVQDRNEPGVNGVTVNLLDELGNVISTTTTGPNGYYSFTQLKPGTYAVEFVKPSSGGYEFTLPTQGISTTDSNADPTRAALGR
ncbi:MAG: hypothetical protein HC853_06230, partial [Anaerolineae bacterium]|nr:hypothetical protein [Anaerolineae bacterium]